MKAIMHTMSPQECNSIFTAEKLRVTLQPSIIVLLKFAPKEVPFKGYIYETKGRFIKSINGKYITYGYGQGKVIGEYLCNKVEYFPYIDLSIPVPVCVGDSFIVEYENGHRITNNEVGRIGLSYEKNEVGGDRKALAGLQISNLIKYNIPREVTDFISIRCTNKKGRCGECKIKPKCIRQLSRPPQSWQYVEQLPN